MKITDYKIDINDLKKISKIKFTKYETEQYIEIQKSLYYNIMIFKKMYLFKFSGESINIYNTKKDNKNNSQYYNYYCYDELFTFAQIFKFYKQHGYEKLKMFDFGCGVSILTISLKKLANVFYIDLEFVGCDINKDYLKLATAIHSDFNNCYFYKLDMTNFDEFSYNWETVDFFYFWNPLIKDKLIDKFITNFKKIVTEKHLIYYVPASIYFKEKMLQNFNSYDSLYIKK